MSLFDDILFSDPSYSLDDAVEYAHFEYREDFNKYWGIGAAAPPEHLSEDDWLEYLRLYGAAEHLVPIALSLIRPPGLRKQESKLPKLLAEEAARERENVNRLLDRIKHEISEDLFRELEDAVSADLSSSRAKHAFFENCVQLQVAGLARDFPGGFGSRVVKLLDYLIRHPGERIRAYLSRVAGCYVRDMKPEFAVMCRAVLDTALQDFVSDEWVQKTVGTGRVGLERRIQYCRAENVFDEEQFAAAKRLKRSGDDAVHFTPGLEARSDELMSDLVAALSALDRSASSSA